MEEGKRDKKEGKGKTSLWNDLNSLKKNRVKFKLPKEELALHRTLVPSGKEKETGLNSSGRFWCAGLPSRRTTLETDLSGIREMSFGLFCIPLGQTT